MKRLVLVTLLAILAGTAGLSACVAAQAAATATPSATVTSSATPSPSATATPSATPSATATPSPTATATPSATPTATRTPRPTATPVPPTKTPTIPATPESGFVDVDIVAVEGLALTDLLAQHAQLAHQMGLTPFVEFTATWCPPCKAIREPLEEGNDLMVDAFRGTYIIHVDVDEWGWGEEGSYLEQIGFSFTFIPIFFWVDESGMPNGDAIGGDAWGENIPINMAPPLKEFFRAHQK